MLPKPEIDAAVAAITAAAGAAPINVQHQVESIVRFTRDLDLTPEQVSDTTFVVRGLEEEGQAFDLWLYCRAGANAAGWTVTGIVMQ